MIYGYVSKASGAKLHKWMNILLINMGLDPDNQVKVIMRGTKLVIDKIYDQPAGAGARGGNMYN